MLKSPMLARFPAFYRVPGIHLPVHWPWALFFHLPLGRAAEIDVYHIPPVMRVFSQCEFPVNIPVPL
jgi:hypothetical protein